VQIYTLLPKRKTTVLRTTVTVKFILKK